MPRPSWVSQRVLARSAGSTGNTTRRCLQPPPSTCFPKEAQRRLGSLGLLLTFCHMKATGNGGVLRQEMVTLTPEPGISTVEGLRFAVLSCAPDWYVFLGDVYSPMAFILLSVNRRGRWLR